MLAGNPAHAGRSILTSQLRQFVPAQRPPLSTVLVRPQGTGSRRRCPGGHHPAAAGFPLPTPDILLRYPPPGQAPTRPLRCPVDNLCTSAWCLCTVCG